MGYVTGTLEGTGATATLASTGATAAPEGTGGTATLGGTGASVSVFAIDYYTETGSRLLIGVSSYLLLDGAGNRLLIAST